MDPLVVIAVATAVGGLIVVVLRIRNRLLEGRNLKQEHDNLLDERDKPSPQRNTIGTVTGNVNITTEGDINQQRPNTSEHIP